MILYTAQFVNKDGLTSACIFSPVSIDDQVADKLRFAQEIIEAQWLTVYNPTACFIVLCQEDAFTDADTQLFNNVWLIDPENWEDIIDSADYTLVNDLMFELCKDKDAQFVGLSLFNANQLLALFEENMFVVVGVC